MSWCKRPCKSSSYGKNLTPRLMTERSVIQTQPVGVRGQEFCSMRWIDSSIHINACQRESVLFMSSTPPLWLCGGRKGGHVIDPLLMIPYAWNHWWINTKNYSLFVTDRSNGRQAEILLWYNIRLFPFVLCVLRLTRRFVSYRQPHKDTCNLFSIFYHMAVNFPFRRPYWR